MSQLDPEQDPDRFIVFREASVEILKGIDEDKRGIHGYCSTEHKDRQDEVVFQKGLDFTEFIQHGYYNDNHNQKTAAVLGIPESVEYKMGKGWYTKGYLLKTKAADEIYELAKALKGTPRKLGFSIEGKVVDRIGSNIKKAVVRNVAITSCPVNTNCSWDLLGKSFAGELTPNDPLLRFFGDSLFVKSLQAGTGSAVRTAETGGRVLVPEDLEHDEVKNVHLCPHCDKGFTSSTSLGTHTKKMHKGLSSSLRVTTFDPGELTRSTKGLTAQEAVQLVKSVHPDWSLGICLKAAKVAAQFALTQKR